MIEIVPTCVPKTADDIARTVAMIRPFAQWIHIDADDGKFTPMTCWPYIEPGVFKEFNLSAAEGLDVEVHLMVQEPRDIGVAFASAGASRIIGHIEAFANSSEAHGALDAWRAAGAGEAGLSLLLGTPLTAIDPLVGVCDVVQMMSSAQIGAQGAAFDPRVLDRIAELHRKHPALLISVDIGVSKATIADLARAGVRRFSAGSAIARSEDPVQAYRELKALAESAIHPVR